MSLTPYFSVKSSDGTVAGWVSSPVRTATRWNPSPSNTHPGNIRATLYTMSSKKYVIKSTHTAIEPTPLDLDTRWDNILSFAGILADSDEMTEEWLADFRQAAWANRLDDIDELTNPQNPA